MAHINGYLRVRFDSRQFVGGPERTIKQNRLGARQRFEQSLVYCRDIRRDQEPGQPSSRSRA